MHHTIDRVHSAKALLKGSACGPMKNTPRTPLPPTLEHRQNYLVNSKPATSEGSRTEMTARSRHESCSQYHRVITCAQRYRVIVCKDGMQWIVQKRLSHAGSRSGAVWRAVSYHRERESLLRLWRAHSGLPAPSALIGLPVYFSPTCQSSK